MKGTTLCQCGCGLDIKPDLKKDLEEIADLKRRLAVLEKE